MSGPAAPSHAAANALITGGMSDIGRATAITLAEDGYGVAVGCRSGEPDASAFAASLVRDHGAPRAVAVRADVRDRSEVERMVSGAWDALGHVRLLVNGAGVNRDRPFAEMSDEEWTEVRSTILDGARLCCQAFAQRYGGDDGCIVNIGAVTAITGRKNGANYCAARAGVVALTKCLALELAPRIRVNTVTPGMIETRETRERYHLDDAQRRRFWESSIPLRRLGAPSDVAEAIRFLAGPGAYITGQNLLVDGGYLPR